MSEAITTAEPIRKPTNRRHRAFCHAVATGMTQIEAYRRYVARTATPAAIRACASPMANRYRDYISQFRAKLADKLEQAGIMSKLELLQYRTRAIRTPADLAADPESDLATVTKTITDGPSGQIITTKVTGPDKTEHAAALAKEAGYEAPAQHQHVHALLESPALRMLDNAVHGLARINLDKAIECEIVAESEAEVVEVDGGQSIDTPEKSSPWLLPDQAQP